SALYFESPEGFGPWTITMRETAIGYLRTLYKKDKTTFNIIVTKLKDLSTGHFSPDNAKMLQGRALDIPMYEAKATGDLRVVGETQAIKIFDVCTHAQMDKSRLWAAANQLGRKIPGFRDRTGIRQKSSEYANKDMFSPAAFPTSPSLSRLLNDDSGLPNLLPENSERVHSRIALSAITLMPSDHLEAIFAEVEMTLPHLVSSQEREVIECDTSCYVIGRSGTGKTTTMLFKMLLIEQTHPDDQRRPRQVFITKSQILARKVQEYFKILTVSLSKASMTLAELMEQRVQDTSMDHIQEQSRLEDANDDVERRNDLPARFSDLDDTHFPLFITYDDLCELIEGDMTETVVDAHLYSARKSTMISFDNSMTESFLAEYWAHFSQERRRKLDPRLVFSEILGVIKGSEEALNEETCCLSAARYISRTGKRYTSALGDRAEDVYWLFEAYKRMKSRRGAIDAADRCVVLLAKGSELKHALVGATRSSMLRALCSNPRGLFWAGDTAQSISDGSSFQFNELKAFQHRLEGASCTRPRLQDNQPRFFTLDVNYRSHSGIVDCACSVIELIYKLWPNSIDKLAPEVGLIEGPKPVFFNNRDHGQLQQFMFGGVGSEIQFGAQQWVLLNLRSSIYESKGLEFSDVLLYDFFADSQVSASHWRVILNAISSWDVPALDESKHGSVCSELKSLYVAITRARENVWIADASNTGEPMRQYWTSLDLVYNCAYAPGENVPPLATSSSFSEWEKQGHTMFERQIYDNAKVCFTRARKPIKAAIANAYDLRQHARATPTVSTMVHQRRRALRDAGFAFLSCAEEPENKSSQVVYFRIAAQCLEEGGDRAAAARAYRSAKEFDEAARLFRDLKEFDNAVDIVNSHKTSMRVDIVESVYKRARLEYFQTAAIEKGLRLFDSADSALQYLDERGLDVARATVLQARGEVVKAAELHYSEGRRKQAIQLLLGAQENDEAVKKGITYLIDEVWRHCSFGTTTAMFTENSTANELITTVRTLGRSYSKAAPGDGDKLAMFMAVSSSGIERGTLLGMGRQFDRSGKRAYALYCLDHVFSEPPETTDHIIEIIEKLSNFLLYATLLSKIAWQPNPADDPSLARLFNYSRVSENTVTLRHSTFLRSKYAKGDASLDINITVHDFERHFREVLVARLTEKGRAMDAIYSRSKPFRPCLDHSVFKHCRFEEEPAQCPFDHVSVEDSNAEWYNQRIRLQLLRMLVFQTLREAEQTKEENTKRMIAELYEIMYPIHPALGSLSQIDIFTEFPEASQALSLLRHWLQSHAYRQRASPMTFITDLLRSNTLVYTFDRQRAIDTNYVYQAPWNNVGAKDPKHLANCERARAMIRSVAGSEVDDSAQSMAYLLNTRAFINIGVLCDFVDHMCSTYVLFNPSKAPREYHNVTLPRQWLVKFFGMDIDKFDATRLRVREKSFTALLDALANVLVQLFTGIGGGAFEKRFRFSDWPYLRDALIESYQADPFDKIVHLLRQSALTPQFRPDMTRHVVYNTVKDILKALGAKPIIVGHGAPNALEEVKAATVIGPTGQIESQDIFDGVTEEVVIPPPTEEQHQMAAVIQQAYRRSCLRAKSIIHGGVRGIRNRLFANYKSITMTDRSYRILALGPLVHVLVCLDVIKTDAPLRRNEARKALDGANSEEMDQMDEVLKKMQQTLRSSTALYHKLKPSAQIHKECSKETLYKLVGEAMKMLSEVPFTASQDIYKDLILARTAFFGSKSSSRPKPKPETPALDDDEHDLDYA
ncbi:hypothetical protein CYLTODRAFT_343644, partial [Cylindrobasidium torrendii FP15055 ss-10]